MSPPREGWTGAQGTGQYPMTQTQYDKLGLKTPEPYIMTNTPPTQPPAGISPLVWSFGISEVRRVVSAVAFTAVAHGIVDSNQSGAFVEIGVGIASYGATMLFNWWMLRGHALVKAQLDRLTNHVQSIPTVPSDMPRAAAVNSAIEAAQTVADGPHANTL